MSKKATLPPPIARIYREVFAATSKRNTSPAGINSERWESDADKLLRKKYLHAVRVGERISFRALLARELDIFIRASRSTEVAGAAELEQIGRLQRRLTKEFVIFYGVDGKPVRKLLRDVRMDELPKIVDYYRRQARGMTRRADRYDALHQQMSLRGCAASDLVCKLVV